MMFRGTVRVVHFVGIGGVGMSGIAEVLLSQGFEVRGSDQREGESVVRLRGLGAQIFIGHDASQVEGADVLVRSTAVSEDNPEVVAARQLQIPVIRRAEMLAELMRLKDGVAVAGSHGKTTTTSMVGRVLQHAGLDPTLVIGGRVDSLGGSNARHGGGSLLVAEADESDGSFNLLAPTLAIITNIDAEHLDHYGTQERLEAAFVEFANRVPFYGFAVLCLDDPTLRRCMPGVERAVVTYGLSRHARYRAEDIQPDGLRVRFRVLVDGEPEGEVCLGMPGTHNVLNALAAFAVARELGVSADDCRQALQDFSGVQRRFTVRGQVGGVTWIDDYAHHPVEIEATLAAAESAFPDGKIHAVFQPHRYSRLVSLLDGFAGAFHRADRVVVCPVYAAGEAAQAGCAPEDIARALRAQGARDVVAVAELSRALDAVADAQPGDVVITLGAGDVGQLCREALARGGSDE